MLNLKKKNDTNEPIYKTVTDVENFPKGEGEENWEMGFDIYSLLCIRQLIRTYCIAQRTLFPTL